MVMRTHLPLFVNIGPGFEFLLKTRDPTNYSMNLYSNHFGGHDE